MKWNTVLHECHEVEHCITWLSWSGTLYYMSVMKWNTV